MRRQADLEKNIINDFQVIINWQDDTALKVLDFADLGFTSAHVYNLWNGRDLGTFDKRYKKVLDFTSGSISIRIRTNNDVMYICFTASI